MRQLKEVETLSNSFQDEDSTPIVDSSRGTLSANIHSAVEQAAAGNQSTDVEDLLLSGSEEEREEDSNSGSYKGRVKNK